MKEKKMCSAVIVAAGSGSRFASDIPKQFCEINEKPVLYYALKAFCDSELIDEVILVAGEEWIDYCTEEVVKKYNLDKVGGIVVGGSERYDSVKSGIMVCDISSDYVFIHDAARPLVNGEIIRRGYETVLKYGTAVAAIPSSDTIKVADEDGVVLSTPDRRNIWRIQTPQIFRYDVILKAYFDITGEDKINLTDDAMLVEKKTNLPVHLFLGSEDNIKITTHTDLEIAETIFAKNRAKRAGSDI